MGSADTGAREPDGSLMFRDESRDTVTNEERLRARVRFLLAEVSAMPDWMRDEFLSGLAAGVGVPPPQESDLVSAPAKERQDARYQVQKFVDQTVRDLGRGALRATLEHSPDPVEDALDVFDRQIDHIAARLEEFFAREARYPNPSAGVGEARPAEPEPDCGCAYELVEDGAVQRKRWFHEPGCPVTLPAGREPGQPHEPKCPKCGHWMRWSARLDVWLCSWCKVRLSAHDRSIV